MANANVDQGPTSSESIARISAALQIGPICLAYERQLRELRNHLALAVARAERAEAALASAKIP
jgi:hypothetical protein